MARSVVILAGVLFALGAARPAQAGERAFALTWRAPEGCPDATTVEQYVDDVLGDATFRPLAVRASGVVSRAADARYAVMLELDAGAAQPSKRSLDADDCDAVSRAAALLIALAIRAQAAPASPAPPPPPPATPPPPAQAPPARGARVFLGALGFADVGAIPAATLGIGVAAGVRWPRLRLESSVAYFAPRSKSAVDSSDAGARFDLAAVGARLCIPLTVTMLWLAPCLGAGADQVRAAGFGARLTRSPSTWDLIGRFGLLGGWDISSIISARIEVEGVLPLARPQFEVEGDGDVFRRAPIGVRTAFGLELQF